MIRAPTPEMPRMALLPRRAPSTYDPNASVEIDLSQTEGAKMLLGEQMAGQRFTAAVIAALIFIALVGLVLLFRHRRRIASAAGDKLLDATAYAVKAKRNLSAKIEERINSAPRE